MRVTVTADVVLTGLEGATERAARPLGSEAVRRRVFDDLRFGTGGVADQFDRQQTMDGASSIGWAPTKPFGNSKTPRRTLQRTGQLREDWLGTGSASVQGGDDRRAAIGVDTSIRGRAAIFQRDAPVRWRASARNSAGRLKAQLFLGVEYDVWVSERKLLEGWLIPPRRVAISDPMVERAKETIATYVTTGEARP